MIMPVTQSGSYSPCKTSGGSCGENELAKGEVMKCPFSAIHRVKVSGEVVFDQVECSRKDCALWGIYRVSESKEIACCCITAIALALSGIMNRMPRKVSL